MKKLELQNFGVVEMDAKEKREIVGGQASPEGVWNSVKSAGKHVLIAAGYAHLANLNAIHAYKNGATAFIAGFFEL